MRIIIIQIDSGAGAFAHSTEGFLTANADFPHQVRNLRGLCCVHLQMGGIIAGTIGAFAGFFFIHFFYKMLGMGDNKLSKFLLEADFKNLFCKTR